MPIDCRVSIRLWRQRLFGAPEEPVRNQMTRSTTTKSDNAIVRYFKDTRAEIAKVTWPTRQEGLRLSWIVLIVTVISAIALFGVDSLFASIIGYIIRIT